MAKSFRRVWKSRGALNERVKRVAYGYTLMANGKQERKVSSAWITETEALEALATRQRGSAPGSSSVPSEL